MIRWLSQLWVSTSVDRGGRPSVLWRWTFGRFASHRGLASQLCQLDGQLRRQAASQQRAIARERLPVGRYNARSAGDNSAATARNVGVFTEGIGWLRPTLAAGSLAVVVAVSWLAWPSDPMQTPQELRLATADSFSRVWEPLSRQAQTTGQALRDQTTQVTELPQRLPKIDRVFNDLGEAIESPIRQEVQRFTDDLRAPWVYLAGQLPRLPRNQTQEQPREET